MIKKYLTLVNKLNYRYGIRLACIPGSLGGAIVMKKGVVKIKISSLIHSINIIDFKGNKKEIKKIRIGIFFTEVPLYQSTI